MILELSSLNTHNSPYFSSYCYCLLSVVITHCFSRPQPYFGMFKFLAPTVQGVGKQEDDSSESQGIPRRSAMYSQWPQKALGIHCIPMYSRCMCTVFPRTLFPCIFQKVFPRPIYLKKPLFPNSLSYRIELNYWTT